MRQRCYKQVALTTAMVDSVDCLTIIISIAFVVANMTICLVPFSLVCMFPSQRFGHIDTNIVSPSSNSLLLYWLALVQPFGRIVNCICFSFPIVMVVYAGMFECIFWCS